MSRSSQSLAVTGVECGKGRLGRRKGVNCMSFLAAAGRSRTLENGPCAGLMDNEQA
jgi:hypothetical protein